MRQQCPRSSLGRRGHAGCTRLLTGMSGTGGRGVEAGGPGALLESPRVRLLLNLIWLIFGGLLMALGYAIVALIMFILIITIPFGIASARIALFCLWPFGRTLIRRPDAGAGSLIGNIIWFLLAGWCLALGHLVTGLLICVTIIGIPLGLAKRPSIESVVRAQAEG